MAHKKLTSQEVSIWMNNFNTFSNLEGEDKYDKLSKLYEEVEQKLNIVGISGIEDKLQEGVPQTIEIIINANIRVWVLTGDKKETALNIGKTCRLIEEIGINQIDLSSSECKSSGEIEKRLDNYIEDMKLFEVDEIKNRELNNRFYLIIDGENLIHIFKDQILKIKFFKVGLICRSVICCRVSPKQKSEVVLLARTVSKSICLSIGDGSNDVPMIMEANIGVGISGKEGTQAVRSSDYAIGQFKFLQRLLFIHGRDGYKRIAYFICYYFYKNIILVFADIAYVFYSGFSGQVFFPSLLTLMYNSFWTSWPCIFAFGFEKDFTSVYNINDRYNILGPHFMGMLKMYQKGRNNEYLNYSTFWKWILYSIYHGAICFFVVTFGLSSSNDGSIFNHWMLSTIVFSCVLIVVTLKLFIETVYWHFLTIIFVILSIGFYFICLLIISLPSIAYDFQFELAYSFNKLVSSSTFWYCLLLVPLMSIIPDLMLRFTNEVLFPTIAQKINNSEFGLVGNLEVRSHVDIIKKITRIIDPREINGRKTFTRKFLPRSESDRIGRSELNLTKEELNLRQRKSMIDDTKVLAKRSLFESLMKSQNHSIKEIKDEESPRNDKFDSIN